MKNGYYLDGFGGIGLIQNGKFTFVMNKDGIESEDWKDVPDTWREKDFTYLGEDKICLNKFKVEWL